MQGEELLDEIYAAIILRDDFIEVERLISPLFSSHCDTFMRIRGAFFESVANAGLNPETVELYNEHYHAMDPWAAVGRLIPVGGVIVGSDLLDLKALERTEYYNEVNKRSDIYDMLAMRIGAQDADVGAITLYSPYGARFSAQHRLLARVLSSHMCRAQRLRKLLEQANAREPKPEPDVFRGLGLTNAEKRVVSLLLEGASSEQMRETLDISNNTLKWHFSNIFQKANVSSKAQLLARLAQGGAVAP